MKTGTIVSLASAILVAAGGAAPGAALPTAQTFTITTVAQTVTGNAAIHETLSLAPDGSRYRLSLANADGSVVSLPVRFTPEGAIATNSQDAAITCYNMAVDVLAHDGQPADNPAAAFVLFGTSVVRVPLAVRSARTLGPARVIEVRGTSAGMFADPTGASAAAGISIDAAVTTSGGELEAARFSEVHYLGTPPRVVGRSTCLLERARRPATAQT